MAYKTVQQRRDAVKEWRLRNPDKQKAQQARYRAKYDVASYIHQWKLDNPEKVKQYRQNYNATVKAALQLYRHTKGE